MVEGRQRRVPISDIEARSAEREQGPEAVGELFSEWLPSLGGELGSMARAGRAWFAVNGDIERAHTCGVYVREPSGRQQLPTLVVYVDSRARVTDFTANREIYRVRLENAGLSFAEIVFRESKRQRGDGSRAGAGSTAAASARTGAAGSGFAGGAASGAAEAALPELTAAEESEIEVLLANVPEGLKKSVAQAMRVSMRAQKRRNS